MGQGVDFRVRSLAMLSSAPSAGCPPTVGPPESGASLRTPQRCRAVPRPGIVAKDGGGAPRAAFGAYDKPGSGPGNTTGSETPGYGRPEAYLTMKRRRAALWAKE